MAEELCMTVEEQTLFTAAFPDVTRSFMAAALEKQNAKKGNKKGLIVFSFLLSF